jgi:hypothetical protein
MVSPDERVTCFLYCRAQVYRRKQNRDTVTLAEKGYCIAGVTLQRLAEDSKKLLLLSNSFFEMAVTRWLHVDRRLIVIPSMSSVRKKSMQAI